MKPIYYNNWLAKLLLLSGYSAMMLFGFIITKLNELSHSTILHERIHQRQYAECVLLSTILALPLVLFISWWWMLLIPAFYYLLYLGECFVRLFMSGDAYENLSFEREAYQNQGNSEYLKERKWFAWVRYYISKFTTEQ